MSKQAAPAAHAAPQRQSADLYRFFTFMNAYWKGRTGSPVREIRMNVLILEHNAELARLWSRHLERRGAAVTCATGLDAAVAALEDSRFDILLLDIECADGAALTVSDLAAYRDPKARVIFVTASRFFSDGSLFSICPNACAYLPSGTPAKDIADMVEHYTPIRA